MKEPSFCKLHINMTFYLHSLIMGAFHHLLSWLDHLKLCFREVITDTRSTISSLVAPITIRDGFTASSMMPPPSSTSTFCCDPNNSSWWIPSPPQPPVSSRRPESELIKLRLSSLLCPEGSAPDSKCDRSCVKVLGWPSVCVKKSCSSLNWLKSSKVLESRFGSYEGEKKS